MDESTTARLNDLNRDFYRRHAASFDETRRTPWPGWERVADRLPTDGRASILDVGCGNGRFGRFLAARPLPAIDYLGLDVSPELLRLAETTLPAGWRLRVADVVADGLPESPSEGVADIFDLIACFGVMHHVPGEVNRSRLVRQMADRLAPGGLLAISFWQFGDRERFSRRSRDWAAHGLAPDQRESGDFLLAWGETDGEGAIPVRYCHHTDRAEARRLVEPLGLELVDEFRADGETADLNLYLLLGSPTAC